MTYEPTYTDRFSGWALSIAAAFVLGAAVGFGVGWLAFS